MSSMPDMDVFGTDDVQTSTSLLTLTIGESTLSGGGAEPNVTTFQESTVATTAPTGSLYLNTGGPQLFVNTGPEDAPTWNALVFQS